MPRKDDTGLKRLITIEIREGSKDDEIFSILYDLISSRKKKETIQLALIYFLLNQSEDVLEIFFGDNLEKAKKIAKKRLNRAKIKSKKVTKKVETKPNIEKVLEENEEIIELKPPIESILNEDNNEPDVVVEEEKTEVEDDSSYDEIKKDLTTENEVMGSSTTGEKEGDFFQKKKKKKKEKSKEDTRTEEQKKADHDKRMAEIIKNAEDADARSEASEKEKMVKWNKD